MQSKLDSLTIGEARQLAEMFQTPKDPNIPMPAKPSPWQIGKNYLIRTVTMIDTGRLVDVGEHELVLEDAAWIPDTGRFSDAIKAVKFSEVEPFPDGRVIIGRGSIIDAVQIPDLPKSQK